MVELNDVIKRYQLGRSEVLALNGVTLSINEAEIIAIMGKSGSGKSTLLNLIGALDVPTEGSVELFGARTDVLSDSALSTLRCNALGFIFQSFNLIPVLTAFENIEYPLLLQDVSAKERRVQVNRLLKAVGLDEHAKHRPDYLSGGQRQRVAIARALVTRPKLVLADEPTANLDSKTGKEILDLMQTMGRDDGTSFLFSTHDDVIRHYADKTYILNDGTLA